MSMYREAHSQSDHRERRVHPPDCRIMCDHPQEIKRKEPAILPLKSNAARQHGKIIAAAAAAAAAAAVLEATGKLRPKNGSIPNKRRRLTTTLHLSRSSLFWYKASQGFWPEKSHLCRISAPLSGQLYNLFLQTFETTGRQFSPIV